MLIVLFSVTCGRLSLLPGTFLLHIKHWRIVSYRIVQKLSLSAKLHSSPVFKAPIIVDAIGTTERRLVPTNYNDGATRRWKSFVDIWCHCFHEIPACDKRTDTQTPDAGIDQTIHCIAWLKILQSIAHAYTSSNAVVSETGNRKTAADIIQFCTQQVPSFCQVWIESVNPCMRNDG